ncbi:T-cell receptor-associated transmembrane adapter 1 [Sorex araneus]|uniref:T-cell receptor-associated transmembrane adapter 1 n=1 Tax=Sorex araneus TaxID=42254 RepID=UPI0024336E1F|nr:T-cell receptor-associated transmembrane adapter 1 [Sorex araneus]
MSGNPECQFYVWAILAFLGLALVISLIFNVSYYVESHRRDKMNMDYNDYNFRENENDIEDIPIYGNLDSMIPETMDENCYEQMKARPERTVNELQEADPPAQVTSDPEMFYASLDHSKEGQRRKPRKLNTHLQDKNEDKQLQEMDACISQATLVDDFSSESQKIEENIHDDPVRLFGLIRAKREPIN